MLKHAFYRLFTLFFGGQMDFFNKPQWDHAEISFDFGTCRTTFSDNFQYWGCVISWWARRYRRVLYCGSRINVKITTAQWHDIGFIMSQLLAMMSTACGNYVPMMLIKYISMSGICSWMLTLCVRFSTSISIFSGSECHLWAIIQTIKHIKVNAETAAISSCLGERKPEKSRDWLNVTSTKSPPGGGINVKANYYLTDLIKWVGRNFDRHTPWEALAMCSRPLQQIIKNEVNAWPSYPYLNLFFTS